MVPLNDLKRWSRDNRELIERAIGRVVERGYYVLGPEVQAFERDFADYCGVRHAIGVGNGTDALELALRSLGIGPGDRVATVANAGMYSAAAIVSVGATPVFIDIDPVMLNMAPAAFEACEAKNVRAVIVTHLYGRLADVERIAAHASKTGQHVIEDCAQAHGARRHGRRAGSFGDIAAFSFYPTKNLGALGDGGAVVTSDNELAARVTRLRQYGWSSKYVADVPGGRNSRLDEMQAAILRDRLPMLDSENVRRRAIAATYCAAAVGFTGLPLGVEAEDYVGHLFVVRSRKRAELAETLASNGVESAVHYPVPDYRQAALSAKLDVAPALPETEQACAEVLSIPCFPELCEQEVARVAKALSLGLAGNPS